MATGTAKHPDRLSDNTSMETSFMIAPFMVPSPTLKWLTFLDVRFLLHVAVPSSSASFPATE